MSRQTGRLHARFETYWPDYERKDLVPVCNGIVSLMKMSVKKNSVDQVVNNWSRVCEFLIKWEGRKV